VEKTIEWIFILSIKIILKMDCFLLNMSILGCLLRGEDFGESGRFIPIQTNHCRFRTLARAWGGVVGAEFTDLSSPPGIRQQQDY
jgi:hypothetical protein